MKYKIKYFLFPLSMLVMFMITCSCKKDDDNPIILHGPNVTDIDGNVYHSVIIRSQTWMIENLNVTHYRNGDSMPNVTDRTEWRNFKQGAYCNFNNTVSNSTTYGKLYNWYAVNDIRNIAPTGWHIPSNEEWTTLITLLGGETVAGGKLKESGYTHWAAPNTGATNSSGFTALPAGSRTYDGSFLGIGGVGAWWSSTENDSINAYYLGVSYDGSIGNDGNLKSVGCSVRCLKDN